VLALEQKLVHQEEINKQTVIQFSPEVEQADEYRALAKAIDGNDMFVIPKPMAQDRLEDILMEHGLLD